jgi:Lrp/AsnC family leucine-responsive transcriptional regulator
MPLDQTDTQIVELLIDDGRMSFREIGDAVGLSANAAADRVRALLRRGVISGFTATVDPQASGRSLEAVVDLRLRDNGNRERFEQLLRDTPAIAFAAHLTGPFDYQLRLACGETAEIDATIAALKNHGGVKDTQTRVVLRRVV